MTLFKPLRPGFSILILIKQCILAFPREMFPFQDTQSSRRALNVTACNMTSWILIM